MIEDYDRLKLRVGMTASHSALDISRHGAIGGAFPISCILSKGEETRRIAEYFKTHKRTVTGRVRRGMVGQGNRHGFVQLML